MIAGDIKYIDNIENFANATFLGFAASVNESIDDRIDSKMALERICLSIKDYSLINCIRKVNLPLLGKGAYSNKFI